jgi:hypothetical protein
MPARIHLREKRTLAGPSGCAVSIARKPPGRLDRWDLAIADKVRDVVIEDFRFFPTDILAWGDSDALRNLSRRWPLSKVCVSHPLATLPAKGLSDETPADELVPN